MADFPAWWPNPGTESPQPDLPSPAQNPGMRDQLKAALDVSQSRPCRADGIVAKELVDSAGPHIMLKNPRAHTYARLSPQEYWIWERMDGTRTVQQLVMAYFVQHKAFAFGAILGLVGRLREQNMLTEPPHTLYTAISQALQVRSLGYRFSWLAREFFTRDFVIRNLDRHMDNIYRAWGWILFTAPLQIILLLVSVIGTVLFLWMTTDPRYQLLGGGIAAAALKLGLVTYIPLVIHEFGHAITAKHVGCEVHRGGVMLYFGLPAAFVETTDVWMYGKKARLAVTWAGPYTGYIIGGALSILVYLWPNLPITTATFLLQVAMMSLFVNTYNLLPVLKLDGYYLLSDSLEIPRLRERSIEFITRTLRPKLLKRERWTRTEVIFLLFGIVAILSTIYFTYAGISFWDHQASQSLASLLRWNGDIVGQIINAFVILLAASAVVYFIYSLAREGPQFIAWLRKKGLLSTSGRSALVLVVGALLFSLLPPVLLPSFATWISLIGTVLTLGLATWLALNTFGSMRGSIHAGMWLPVVAGLAAWALSVAVSIGESSSYPMVLSLAGLISCLLAIFPAWRLLTGLPGSWRAVSIALLTLGLFTWAVTLFIRGLPPFELVQFTGALIVIGGLLHWQMRPATILAQAAPGSESRSGTTRARIVEAFNAIKQTILSELGADFGLKTRERVEKGSYRTIQVWGLGKKRIATSETMFNSTKAGMTPDDYGGAIALMLDEILTGVQNAAGKSYARRALAYGFDHLDWELQELAEDYLLHYIPKAAGLTTQLSKARSARDDILTLVRSAPIFMSLTEEEILVVSKQARLQRFSRGDLVIRQGEPGNAFYLIRIGKVEVVQRDADGEHKLIELARGDYFGESALLTGDPRNASVRAILPAEILVLKRDDFNRLLRKNFNLQGKVQESMRRLQLLRQAPLFAEFIGEDLCRVAGKLDSLEAPVGKPVFQHGDPGDQFYIIESGKVSVQMPAAEGDHQLVERATLGAGEYFGEIALLMNEPRTATVIPIQPTMLLALSARDFREIINESGGMKQALERASSRRVLSNERWNRLAQSKQMADKQETIEQT